MLEYSYILRLAKAYAIKAYKENKDAGYYNSADYWKNIVFELSKMHKEYTETEVTT